MCLNIQVVCPGCGLVAEQRQEKCPYHGTAYWGVHITFPETRTLQASQLLWWSCPTRDCELNRRLHWTLAALQEAAAVREGAGGYPQGGHACTTALEADGEEIDEDADEACELALSPEEVGVPDAPQPGTLSAKERRTVREMVESGETIKDIAEALGRGNTSTSKYIAAYYRPNPFSSAVKVRVPLPERDDDEEEDSSENDDEYEPLPRICIRTTKQVPGAPHLRWLRARERRLVQRMRAWGETKRSIAGVLGKHRTQLVKYINAYVIPLEAGVVADARAVPAVPAPAPALPFGKRKRGEEDEEEEENQAEPVRFSKRLRVKYGAGTCVDCVVVRGG